MPTIRTQAPSADPDVVVPRAVRQAAERATTAQYESIGQAEPPVNGAIPPGTPPGAPAPAAGPSSLPQLQEQPESEQTWEHKYKSLQGRLADDRKKSGEIIGELSERIRKMEEQQITRPQAPPPKRPLQISPDEMSDYGEDFISMVQRIAQHTVDGRIEPLAQEVGRTQRQVGVQENRTMHQRMAELYPEWEQMNGDERFIAWTQLPDPYSGAIRGSLMQEAWNSGDARRVLAFFQGFLAEEAALNPQGQGRQLVAPLAPPNGAPAPAPPLTLTQLAAPGGARSAQQQPAEKPVYSTEDITRFYTEVAAGRWRHREQERAAIDQDIMRAQHEGRIILNQRRFTPPEPPRGMTR